MEDAYVIGIRLALDNGVSAGIAAIAHDLEGLDGAIAATTAHLSQLRTAAGATGEAIAADFQRLARQGERLVRVPTPPPVELAPASSPAASPPASPTLSYRTMSPSSSPTETTLPAPTTPLPRERPNPPVIRIAPVVSLPQSSSLMTPALDATPPSAPPARPPTAPNIDVPRPSVRLAPPATSSAHGKSPDRGHNQPVTAPATAPVRPLPAATSGEGPLARSAHDRPAATAAAAPFAYAPAAYAPATPASAAPAAAGHSSGPAQGDVFLDGMRLGRWMTSHLAHEATQPPTGASAFDPRMGLSWPGSQQGY